jgi:hypothetical protein
MNPIERALSPAQREAWRACRAPGEMPVREFARETERSPGTISNHLRRAEDNLAGALAAFAGASERVDFLDERDDRTTSWERAAPMADETRIRRLNHFAWLVQLPDGHAHVVALIREGGFFKGWCDCNGWEYRDDADSPCAHLCTLRQGAFIQVRTDEGERVRVEEADAGRQAVTDGGREVVDREHAGADGREFGKPWGGR